MIPKGDVDLKIVALMGRYIKEYFVAGEIEINFDGANANGLSGLAVQITSETNLFP